MGTTDQDGWDVVNDIMIWAKQHHCVLFSFVFSKKIKHYSFEHGLSPQGLVQYFFDYDEAYQTCLDKLAEAQS